MSSLSNKGFFMGQVKVSQVILRDMMGWLVGLK